MLVEFSVGNFWSFKEIQSLPLRAAKIASKYPQVDAENVVAVNEQLSLLKTKAVFGANGSGKSNLVRAIKCMEFIIADSLKDMNALETVIIPFAFSTETAQQPSFFQVVFVHEQTIFRYGFEATSTAIVAEWLFGKALNAKKGARERFYFTREGNQVEVNESLLKEAKEKHLTMTDSMSPPLFRDNTLYFTLLATYNVGLILSLYHYLLSHVMTLSLEVDDVAATRAMASPKFRDQVTGFLQAIDPTITAVKIEKGQVLTLRQFEGGDGTTHTPLLLAFQEAEGTKKAFALSPYLLTTLEKGGVLIIDEFDARMHPQLTRKIVELFHAPSTNPHQAQLVFITHDSNLMDPHLLRRDQISFAQKNRNGATELYTLAEFKGVRNDASFEKDYLQGKYHAVPTNLNQLEALLD